MRDKTRLCGEKPDIGMRSSSIETRTMELANGTQINTAIITHRGRGHESNIQLDIDEDAHYWRRKRILILDIR